MPKRKAEFSEGSVIAQLIWEVKNRPCLWNCDDDNYKDRYHTATAWKEISKTLDYHVDTVRIKWKSIRDFFNKLVKKRKIKKLDDYIGRWRHFKSLWFLYKPDILQIDNGSCEGNTTNTRTHLVKCEPINLSEGEISIEENDLMADKKQSAKEDEDFDMMFLKSLTPFLKQLEPIRKLVVRSKIQEILLNEIASQATSSKKFYEFVQPIFITFHD